MKIATWNVNGIRAREAQLLEWFDREQPDVVCLQEIKARPDQVPASLLALPGYWCYWHGAAAYSGVALFVRMDRFPEQPRFEHPSFDRETRVVQVTLGPIVVASIYVPNGGKDFDAKMEFLRDLRNWVESFRGKELVLCGDMNVARTDMDVHAKERKPGVIGQRPDERSLFEEVIGNGLVDIARTLHPDAEDFFTWWAPWRNLRQRNIGWRIDYILASESIATRAVSCESLRETGTSDHAPLIASFDDKANS